MDAVIKIIQNGDDNNNGGYGDGGDSGSGSRGSSDRDSRGSSPSSSCISSSAARTWNTRQYYYDVPPHLCLGAPLLKFSLPPGEVGLPGVAGL